MSSKRILLASGGAGAVALLALIAFLAFRPPAPAEEFRTITTTSIYRLAEMCKFAETPPTRRDGGMALTPRIARELDLDPAASIIKLDHERIVDETSFNRATQQLLDTHHTTFDLVYVLDEVEHTVHYTEMIEFVF